MDFFLKDLYPNMGFQDTRAETIPEADDRKALAEDEKASSNAKTNPVQKNKIWTAFIILLAVVLVLGVLK